MVIVGDSVGIRVIKNRGIIEDPIKIKEGNPEEPDQRLEEVMCTCGDDRLVQDQKDPEFMWCLACYRRKIVTHFTNDKPDPKIYTTTE